MTGTDPIVESDDEDGHHERVRVGIAEYAVTGDGGRLVTSGLGSRVGVALVDRSAGVRGLAHVMLPEDDGDGGDERPAKYADTGVRCLLEEMEAAGADPDRVTAQLAGGSEMLSLSQGIGERNAAAVRETLDELGIPVASADVGGSDGRWLSLEPGGELEVTTADSGCGPLPPSLSSTRRE